MKKVYEELKNGLIDGQLEIMTKIGGLHALNTYDETKEAINVLMDVYRDLDLHILRVDRKLHGYIFK